MSFGYKNETYRVDYLKEAPEKKKKSGVGLFRRQHGRSIEAGQAIGSWQREPEKKKSLAAATAKLWGKTSHYEMPNKKQDYFKAFRKKVQSEQMFSPCFIVP